MRILTGGLSSARACRIVVAGRPYLLRVMTSTEAAPGPGQGDPTRQFAGMRKAAEAGLAPRVWYTSIEDRISITGFVQARPLPRTEALARLPKTLQAVHALPAFPRRVNFLDSLEGFIRRFRAANILPESATADGGTVPRVRSSGEGLSAKRSGVVSSHNDLKPENVLFDGERVWLVDWEASFLNDRYADLSVVANFIVTTEAEEEAYLRSYFGKAAGDYRLARFYLMRQVLHMFYAMVFVLIGWSGKPI